MKFYFPTFICKLNLKQFYNKFTGSISTYTIFKSQNFSCAQDYDSFYTEEIGFRRKLSYPPFVALASILIKHSNYNYAFDNEQILKDYLNSANSEKMCRILGVAPAPLTRLKGEFRLQILVKARNRAKLRETLDFALHDAQEKFCDLKIVYVEIDPVNLL